MVTYPNDEYFGGDLSLLLLLLLVFAFWWWKRVPKTTNSIVVYSVVYWVSVVVDSSCFGRSKWRSRSWLVCGLFRV